MFPPLLGDVFLFRLSDPEPGREADVIWVRMMCLPFGATQEPSRRTLGRGETLSRRASAAALLPLELAVNVDRRSSDMRVDAWTGGRGLRGCELWPTT